MSKVIAKDHPIMRVFNTKGDYKDLFNAVMQFKQPIDSNSSQTNTIIQFFEFAISKTPEIRSSSTGREFGLHSSEAKHMFGDSLAGIMYVAMNKVTHLMTCNIQPTNDRIFEFFMEFYVTMFEAFLESEIMEKSITAMKSAETPEENGVAMDTTSANKSVVVTEEEESNDLLQSILQYKTKFLICHVETKGEKQSTRKMIITNLVMNMRKKTNDFMSAIVPNVLKGKQRLVDRALEDYIPQYTYHSRDAMRQHQQTSTITKSDGILKLQTIPYGYGFSSFHHIELSKPYKAVEIPTAFSFPTTKPFMRLEITKTTDDKGQLQCVAKWFEGKNFLQALIEHINEQVQSLDVILTEIREIIQAAEPIEDYEFVDETTGAISIIKDPLPTLRANHAFLKKKESGVFFFPLKDFFLNWQAEFVNLHEIFHNTSEQPSISEKMVFVDCCFHECLQLCHQTDIKAATIMRFKVDAALTSIMNAIRTSPLNIAIVGILNHNEFPVCDVLRDPFNKQLHTSAKKMSEYVGSQHMALVAQAGIAYFDTGKIRKFRSMNTTRTKREKDEDRSAMEELEDDKLSTQILTLVTDNDLPKVDHLQKMLKGAFSQLKQPQLLLLQSILKCLWTLQEWTRPLDYLEEKFIQNAGENRPGKKIYPTQREDECETEAKKKVKNIKFKAITNQNSQVSSDIVLPTANQTVQDECTALQTPVNGKVQSATPISSKTRTNTPVIAKTTHISLDTITSVQGSRKSASINFLKTNTNKRERPRSDEDDSYSNDEYVDAEEEEESDKEHEESEREHEYDIDDDSTMQPRVQNAKGARYITKVARKSTSLKGITPNHDKLLTSRPQHKKSKLTSSSSSSSSSSSLSKSSQQKRR